jgi:hypothetical protein
VRETKISKAYASETELQSDIIKTLTKLGYWAVRSARAKRRGRRSINTGEDGFPDVTVVGLGYIEVKMLGKDLEEDQVDWHAKAKRRGVKVGTAWCVEDAIRIVRGWE